MENDSYGDIPALPIDPIRLIGPDDLVSTQLPEAHFDNHVYAFYLHDTVLTYLRYADAAKVLSVPITVASEQERLEVEALAGEPLADWLEQHYPAASHELLRRQMFGGLVGDALHFLHEALRCSEKGKLTVAYALLRKPFRENLLFLELLLADQERFVRVMANPDAKRRGLAFLSQRERGRAIVRDAVAKSSKAHGFDADFIYDIRYGKAAHYSMESLWHQAVHLVTEHAAYQTSIQNLNFVFSDHEDRIAQWDRLYQLTPFLLFHFVEVVVALLGRYTGGAFVEPYDIAFRRKCGFILWSDRQRRDEIGSEAGTVSDNRTPIERYTIECPGCGASLLGNTAAARRSFTLLRINCDQCGAGMRISSTGVEPALGTYLRRVARQRHRLGFVFSQRDRPPHPSRVHH